MEFLIRGVQEFNEPGVLVAIEETPQELERDAMNRTRLGDSRVTKRMALAKAA
jgi:hypothetical protein